jgi:L-asparaginase
VSEVGVSSTRRSRVGIVATGGTIAAGAVGGLLEPVHGPAALLAHAGPLDDNLDITVVREIGRKVSSEMMLSDMVEIVRECRDIVDEFDLDGVIVLQGTATLLTSAFLAYLIWDRSVPIVLTGSMEPMDAVGSDGPRNVRDAASAAVHTRLRDARAVIVMDGIIHNPRYARKVHTTAFGAISGDGYATLGYVDRSRVIVHHRGFHPPQLTIGDAPLVSTPILKAVTGLGPELLLQVSDRLAAGSAVVIECFPGSGAVPAQWAAALKGLLEQGVHVIFASEPAGPISPRYAGPGHVQYYLDHGGISAGDLRPDQSSTLASLLLTQQGAGRSFAERFREYTH